MLIFCSLPNLTARDIQYTSRRFSCVFPCTRVRKLNILKWDFPTSFWWYSPGLDFFLACDVWLFDFAGLFVSKNFPTDPWRSIPQTPWPNSLCSVGVPLDCMFLFKVADLSLDIFGFTIRKTDGKLDEKLLETPGFGGLTQGQIYNYVFHGQLKPQPDFFVTVEPQPMVNWWFGSRWLGILGLPLSNNPFIFGDPFGFQTTGPRTTN